MTQYKRHSNITVNLAGEIIYLTDTVTGQTVPFPVNDASEIIDRITDASRHIRNPKVYSFPSDDRDTK